MGPTDKINQNNNNTHFTDKLLLFTIYISSNIFFFDHNKIYKKQKVSAFDIVE